MFSGSLRCLRTQTASLGSSLGEVCSFTETRSRVQHPLRVHLPAVGASISAKPSLSLLRQFGAYARSTQLASLKWWSSLEAPRDAFRRTALLVSCSHGQNVIRNVTSLRQTIGSVSFLQYLVQEVELPEDIAEKLILQPRVTLQNLRALEAVMAKEAGMTSAQWRALLKSTKARPALGRDAEVVQKTLAYFRSELSMSRAAVQKIVMQRPPLLTLHLDDNIARKVKFFRDSLGMSGAEIGRTLFKYAALFTHSIDNLTESMSYFMVELGLSQFQMRKVVMMAPSALGRSLEDNIMVTVSFMSQALQMSHREVGSLVTLHPQILTYSKDHVLKPIHAFFRKELGLSELQVRKVLRRQPGLIGLSIKTCLRPKIEFFASQLGIDRKELGSMVAKSPSLLSYHTSNNIQVKATLLQERLCLSPQELRKMVKQQPSLLHLSIDNLDTTIRFLLSLGGPLPIHPNPLLTVQRIADHLLC